MAGEARPVIELSDLFRVYGEGEEAVHALDGVSMTIREGEFVAIMGPSGSGKSTMMNVIGCLDTPSSGEYELNGKIVSSFTDDELAKIRNEEIGFVFQTFNLLARTTALQNVELPLIYAGLTPHERHERSQQALENVGLGLRSEHMPNQLSGGQRQRVAIARALVSRPALVLADEPTANLDSATGKAIIDLMHELNRQENVTFLFSTHDHAVTSRAERLVRVSDGLILREGEPHTDDTTELEEGSWSGSGVSS